MKRGHLFPPVLIENREIKQPENILNNGEKFKNKNNKLTKRKPYFKMLSFCF